MEEIVEQPASIQITEVKPESFSSEPAVNSAIADDKDAAAEVATTTEIKEEKEEVKKPDSVDDKKPEDKKEAKKATKSKKDDNILELVAPETEAADSTKKDDKKDVVPADKPADTIDYKAEYEKAVAERTTMTSELQSYKGDVKHEAVKHLKDYLDKGGNPADYYKAQTIDAESIPADTLIEDFYKRKNPDYDKMMLEVGLEDDYGIGTDLDKAITDAKEANDRTELSKLMKIKQNRIAAVNEQKAFLREQKNTLLENKNAPQELSPEDLTRMKSDFDNDFKVKVDAVKEITVGNYKLPINQGDLHNENIVIKDKNTGLLYVNIDEAELAQAMHFWKIKDQVFSALEKKINVQAEIKADEEYNNSKGTVLKPSHNGQSSIQIRQLS